MQEIELKCQIPAAALAGIQAQLRRINNGQDTEVRLRAAYFDTPERRLGGARMALRVRQEGNEWVQTLKAGGSNTMMRLEANCPAQAPQEGQPIELDLSRHLNTPAQDALARVLNWSAQTDPTGRHCGLIELYGTDIVRTRAHITVGAGTAWQSVVELALDLGQIHAGPLSLAVQELEIELVSGHPMAVIHVTRQWVHAHGLWLDTQTKAHRGDRLARQAQALPAQTDVGNAPDKAPDAAPAPSWRAQLEGCLAHITGHISELGTAPADVAPLARQWREALQHLIAASQFDVGTDVQPEAPCDALPADTLALAQALIHQLDDALAQRDGAASSAAVIELARSSAATDLCLDLLACLTGCLTGCLTDQAD